jgi:hypothetical protein
MSKIVLSFDRVLQGNFELQAVNLLFVFQVNCPGCFLDGFPLANRLYGEYAQRGLQVLGLSTAFEDFDLNTAENTELLLQEKLTVGATRKAIGDRYSQAIDFPIAVDTLITDARTQSQSSVTFSLNQLPGTPTFLLIDRDLQLLTQWFRHRLDTAVIDRYLNDR